LPTIAFLTRATTWTFYWRQLPEVIGAPALALGLAGVAAGLLLARWRTEAAHVAIWIVVVIVSMSLLPARDPRYILSLAPAFVIAATIGLRSAVGYLPPLGAPWQAAGLAAGLVVGYWSAAHTQVPHVSGFREIAVYLQQLGPKDAVLYDGEYSGLLGFYVRASDPNLERRVVLADKILYSYGPTTTFEWIQHSNVTSTDDVVALLRTRSGCKWIAIEVGPTPAWASGQRLLRQAVARPEFVLARSFPIAGSGSRRVDLYRMVDPVNPVAAVDLSFPSFSDRTFQHVSPIHR